MTSRAAVLAMITFLCLVGCSEAPHLEVEAGDIQELRVHDFNWELGQTLVYRVTKNELVVYDEKSPDVIIESHPIPPDGNLWKAIDGITKIYTDPMVDERVCDGTSVTFVFVLKDGSRRKTYLSNLIVKRYAAVTKAISDTASSDIHYHQYDSRKYD